MRDTVHNSQRGIESTPRSRRHEKRVKRSADRASGIALATVGILTIPSGALSIVSVPAHSQGPLFGSSFDGTPASTPDPLLPSESSTPSATPFGFPNPTTRETVKVTLEGVRVSSVGFPVKTAMFVCRHRPLSPHRFTSSRGSTCPAPCSSPHSNPSRSCTDTRKSCGADVSPVKFAYTSLLPPPPALLCHCPFPSSPSQPKTSSVRTDTHVFHSTVRMDTPSIVRMDTLSTLG
jgi:hypothetical protein